MLYTCCIIVTNMAKIVVEVTDEMKMKLKDFSKRGGFRTMSEAVRAILREYLLKGDENNGQK